MKFWVLFFLPICALASFSDPVSGLRIDIPEKYVFMEDESKTTCEDNVWWYTYEDDRGNQLILEIELYDHLLSHFEYFHNAMTDGKDEELDEENCILDHLQFRHEKLGDREFTICQMRALATDYTWMQPLYICDYLFVEGQYGISLSLLHWDDDDFHQSQLDAFMKKLANSVRFENLLSTQS